MTKAESEKVIAVLCQADGGCALCVAKQLAMFCIIFDVEVEWAVATACDSEPLGIAESDLLEMTEDEVQQILSAPQSNYLPV